MQKTLVIDEEGYFVLPPNIRLTDTASGSDLLKNLSMKENGSTTTLWSGEMVLVEAFDRPLVVQQIHADSNHILLQFPYGFSRRLLPETLCADAWDRFQGLTEDRIPFVFSRKAQAELFNQLSDYDDDSISLFGKNYPVAPFYIDNDDVNKMDFWQSLYAAEDLPPWDLNGPHPAIDPILPQIKLNKSRILNFGCGRGHDAAFLAQKGHIVTGVDLSSEAVSQARDTYGNIANLEFCAEDIFTSQRKADVIFEHTLFCAIAPRDRQKLVIKWHQCLESEGYLLGIFFVMPKRGGPPYGASEWEIRQHLEKHFRLLYWKRWALSPERRHGTELVVFAQKLPR